MTDSNYLAEIVAGGQRYQAWESVTVRRDAGDAISYFQFTAAEPGPFGQGWDSLRLKPGDPCQIYLAGKLVLTGAVTTRVTSYDASTHDIIIAGRSLTAETLSSVDTKPGTFDGNTLQQAAQGVLQPHGIGFVLKNPPAIASKPFAKLMPQFGETVIEFIERMTRFRGLIIADDENGNLVCGALDQSSSSVAELKEGGNILRATGKLDDQTAFGKVRAAGQTVGNDQNWATPARDIAAEATSGAAKASRLNQFYAEHPVDSEDLKERVNHEMARTLWPVVECSVTVTGWLKPDGNLWQIFEIVTLNSPMIFPNESGSMLLGVQAVVYAQDSQNGTTTTLELRLPWALTTAQAPSTPGPQVEADPTTSPPSPAQVLPPDVGQV